MCLTVYCVCIVDDLQQFSSECKDLYFHFQHRNLEALLSAVKGSIDVLRRRITARCAHISL